ncbi:hypothetical protein CGRA01v4_04893 [Colletotrichum graminicola]|nr:hypothetical protein CGRA01v4_04893 [Colletotrichum graminicola]
MPDSLRNLKDYPTMSSCSTPCHRRPRSGTHRLCHQFSPCNPTPREPVFFHPINSLITKPPALPYECNKAAACKPTSCGLYKKTGFCRGSIAT